MAPIAGQPGVGAGYGRARATERVGPTSSSAGRSARVDEHLRARPTRLSKAALKTRSPGSSAARPSRATGRCSSTVACPGWVRNRYGRARAARRDRWHNGADTIVWLADAAGKTGRTGGFFSDRRKIELVSAARRHETEVRVSSRLRRLSLAGADDSQLWQKNRFAWSSARTCAARIAGVLAVALVGGVRPSSGSPAPRAPGRLGAVARTCSLIHHRHASGRIGSAPYGNRERA